MTLKFELAGAQIDGARDYQEDAFLVTHLEDADGNPSALIIVADGMGGHAAGNVASNMAVQSFNKHVTANYPTDNLSDVLNDGVLKANASIAETVKETPALEGMGCTMIATILEKNNIWWASVGDSHIYLLRNRELTKVNADHSYGGFLDRMAEAGTPVDAEPGLSKNMLMSAITGADISDIDCPPVPLQLEDGDKILICSDGMDTLSTGKIIQYADWSDSPKEAADALLNAVEEAGMPKQDNTTIVVINVTEAAETTTQTSPAETASEKIASETPTPEEDDSNLDKTIPPIEAAAQETQPEPEPEPAPDTQEAPVTTATGEKKGKAGLIIGGIIASVIIVISIAGFFIFGGTESKIESEPEQAEITDTEIQEIMEEEMAETQPEAEEEPVIEEEPVTKEEETPPETTPIEKPVTETVTTAAKTDTAEKPKVEQMSEKPPEPQTQVPDSSKKEFRDKLKDGKPAPEMVWIPAGSFEMGYKGASGNIDEQPRHTVNVKKFAISKYEIKFTEYDEFASATGRKLPDNLYMDREVHPVIFVTWDDAYYYAKWLSEQTGKKYRLPSESEWEYAASAATGTPFWWGFNEEAGRAHCFGCGTGLDPRKPAKVGNFGPNPFGLYDTAGNVAEWVNDCWHDNYKNAPTDSEVWEGGDCAYRVVRGGSYISPPQSIRSNKRDKLKSDSGYDHVGFRVIRDPD